MKYLSLFSGIGGIDLGLDRAGMTCIGQVEIDPYCRAVLAKHWPHVPRWSDIKEFKGDECERPDLIAGGFPCQDISVGGSAAGLEGERSGLWFEFRRIIRSLRPQFVFVENVSALLVRGLGTVLGNMASDGYDAEWRVFQANEFGAPHQRQRLFIVAYSNEIMGKSRNGDFQNWTPKIFRSRPDGGNEFWLQAPDFPCDLDDGIPAGIYEPAVAALGNAVVPQVAEYIGRLIMQAAIGGHP